MREQEYTTPVAFRNKNPNLYRRKPSYLDQFTNWFRDFIENAE